MAKSQGVKGGKKGVKTPLSSPVERTNAEKVVAVIQRINEGESEREACRNEDISRSTFRTTALRQQSGDQYAKALYGLAQDQIEKIEKTIEDMRNGTVDAAMARVEIDTRKWFASKFLPRQYGDKLDVTSDGKAMPQPILQMLVTASKPSDDTSREIVEGDLVVDDTAQIEAKRSPNHDSVPTSTPDSPISDSDKPKNIMDDIN